MLPLHFLTHRSQLIHVFGSHLFPSDRQSAPAGPEERTMETAAEAARTSAARNIPEPPWKGGVKQGLNAQASTTANEFWFDPTSLWLIFPARPELETCGRSKRAVEDDAGSGRE
jgi:hypothetical protein